MDLLNKKMFLLEQPARVTGWRANSKIVHTVAFKESAKKVPDINSNGKPENILTNFLLKGIAHTEPKQLKVLHIEDVATDAELVQRALRKAGINCEIQVVDKEEAFINSLQQLQPDVILSDHSLPSFNSHRALNIVRGQGLKTPFILITGTVSEEYAVNMIKQGADDYILKDRLERLPAAVLQALEMRKKEQEHAEFMETVMTHEAILRETERLAHVGSWHINFLRGTSTWSDEMYRILGYMPGEVEASLDNFIKHVHHKEAVHVSELIYDAIKVLPGIKIEFRVLDRMGIEKYLFCQLVIKRHENGELKELSGFVQDVTERKKAENEIVQLNQLLEKKVEQRTAQLEAANKELEAFCYSVSHDLRSPLRIQSGFSTILQKRYGEKLDEEAREYLDLISDSAVYMKKLIDGLLNLSRFGRAALNPVNVDMNRQVNIVLTEIRAMQATQNVKIKQQPLQNAMGDPVLIHQVWVNLISNALKYSGKKEQPVIEIGCIEQNGSNVYYVKDNGVGFNMNEADKLFGVFKRLHEESEFEGTGIGLALVQRIVTKHGGKVWAEAEVDKGATFYFSLPKVFEQPA